MIINGHLILYIQLILICPLLFIRLTCALKWLSGLYTYSLTEATANRTICDSIKGMNKKQRTICKRQFELMDAVLSGTRMAISECQIIMSDRGWNCSSLLTDPESEKRRRGNLEVTKELAFIHAIVSASVSYSITQACSRGNLLTCGCDQSVIETPENFRWAGCSDNVDFALAFSKNFLDAKNQQVLRSKKAGRAKTRSAINLHNLQAGRKVIKDNVKINCRCHGVSGSCELKTCWRSHPSIREVGAILRKKIDHAHPIKLNKLT